MYSGFETESKPSNLQPFQYPVPEGFEVVTRSGEKVTQLVKFECEENFPIVAIINNKTMHTYTHDGFSYVDHDPFYKDLLLRPIPRERWVVVNHKSTWMYNYLFEGEEEAENHIQTVPNSDNYSIHKITLP